jgi:hypothetical protein
VKQLEAGFGPLFFHRLTPPDPPPYICTAQPTGS